LKSNVRLGLRRCWPALRLESTCSGIFVRQSLQRIGEGQRYEQMSRVVLVCTWSSVYVLYHGQYACRGRQRATSIQIPSSTTESEPTLDILRLGPVVVSLPLPTLLERLHLWFLLSVSYFESSRQFYISRHDSCESIGRPPTSSLQARQSFFS
jgi:hypothetical protein